MNTPALQAEFPLLGNGMQVSWIRLVQQVMDVAKDYSLHQFDRPDPLNAPLQIGGMFALVPGHTSYAGC